MKKSIFFGFILTVLISVNGNPPGALQAVGHVGPHVIVYKTKANYSRYVSVTISDDRSKIVSYPAPQDISIGGKLTVPTELPHGFWLDNRGIAANSVFIKITYEEYAKLTHAPAIDELYKLIIDKAPFTEMYDLGMRNKFKDTEEIKEIVKKHKLKEYKRLI